MASCVALDRQRVGDFSNRLIKQQLTREVHGGQPTVSRQKPRQPEFVSLEIVLKSTEEPLEQRAITGRTRASHRVVIMIVLHTGVRTRLCTRIH